MTDRKIVDEQPEDAEPGPLHKKGAWLRGTTRGLHLQQIDEPVDEDVYDGVGADMRAERQRRNLAIADVAATLRIQQTYLEALEEGRTDDLPGPTYAIGFLRTYSEFLGLDGDEIIRQFKLEATLTPVERRLVFPEPLEEARRPGLSLALISLLVAGAVYGAWIFLEQRDLVPIEAVTEPPQRLAPYQAATETVKPVEASPQKVTAAPTTTATASATAPDTTATAAMAPPSPEAEAAAPQAEQEQSGPGDDQAGSAGDAGATASMAAIQPQNDPVQSTVQSTTQSPVHSSVQPTDRAPEQSSDQAAVEVQAEPGEGERAAAADVSGLANTVDAGGTAAQTDPAASIGEIPATAGSATQAADASTQASNDTSADTSTDTSTVAAAEASSEGSTEKPSETVTETASNTSDSAPKPVAEEQGTPAATTAEASMAQPDVQGTTPSTSSSPSPSPSPTPVREGSDVDTAPAMPSIQAAIAPPPPPAAPAAPARPLSEGSGEEASGGGTGVASLTAPSDSLSYRPQTYGASNRDVRVVLRARAESWVQIQGANNELLLTRMLRPGDSYHAPNRTDLVLMTGNAGAIEIMVDGEALGTLGPMGQVRRNIKLNADHLRGQLQAAEDPRPEVR